MFHWIVGADYESVSCDIMIDCRFLWNIVQQHLCAHHITFHHCKA